MSEENPGVKGIIGGTSRHYVGRGIGVHAGMPGYDAEGNIVPAQVVAHVDVGAAVQWKCPNCRTTNIGKPEDGCPSCGAGTKQQAEAALAKANEGKISADEAAQQVLGLADGTAADLQGWSTCIRPQAQLSLCRALAFYAENGDPGMGELTRDQILAWARVVMPSGE